MGGPDCQNGFFGADACASRVSARSEPVVLRSSGGSGPIACIGHAVDGLAKHPIEEQHVIGDHSCSEVMREVVAAVDDGVDVLVAVLNDQLEGAEQLLTA